MRGFRVQTNTTIMKKFFQTPNREEQRVLIVYCNGLLDGEFINYNEALTHCRYLMSLGYEAEMKSRYLDESEY